MQITRNLEVREKRWAGPFTPPGARQQVQHCVVGTVELLIDVDAILRQVGGRALWNKSGKARAMAGAISARAHSVKRTQEPVFAGGAAS